MGHIAKHFRITRTPFYIYKMLHCSSYFFFIIGGLGLAAGVPVERETYPRVHCRTEYITVWETEYEERETKDCVTKWVPECYMVFEKQCKPKYKEVCDTVYKKVCEEHHKTEYEPYTETECNTEYKEDCEYHWVGEGYDKRWVAIPGTCKTNPHHKCRDVTKHKERQVPYEKCHDVPEEHCTDVPHHVCHQVTKQYCTNEPQEKCTKKPKEECNYLHKKVPIRVSKKIPKKVCNDGYTPVVKNQAPATNEAPVTDQVEVLNEAPIANETPAPSEFNYNEYGDRDDEDDAGLDYSDNVENNVHDAVIVRDYDDAPLAQINVRQALPLRQAPVVDAAVKKDYREGTFSCNVTHCI